MRRFLTAIAFALWATTASAQVITPVNMRDANLTLSNVQNLVTTLNTFTAQRTLTLPGAGVMNSYYLQFIDTANAISGANTLRIVSADGTLVNGLSALTVSAAGVYLFILPSPSGYSVSAIYPLGASTPAGGTNGQIQYNNAGFLGGFTMSADMTVNTSTGAATLATVNTNTGTWGSATLCAAFTTNGKGLITAAAQSACTPALANITGMGTGVATALAIAVGSAGSVVTNGGALGTPSSGTLTNTTGFPVANLAGAGAGCVTWLATPSSANLRGCLTDETGTGLAYFQGGDIGTPSAGVGTNLTALNATQLTSGTIPAARLPNPSASTLGGIQSLTCAANQWLNTISTLGVPACAQPAFSNLSGALATTQVPTGGSSGQVLSTNGSGTGSYISTKALVTGASINTLTQGTTSYFTNNACGTSSGLCQIPVPYAGTIKGCTYASNGAPAAGQSYTFTLMKNGSTTTNTAQIVNSTPLTNGFAVIADTTHTVSFAANDLYTIQVVLTATAGTTNFSFSCEYDSP